MTDIERMAQMWNRDGMSQSQIGRVMGVSPSAVAGKIFRNRDLFPKRQKGQRPAVQGILARSGDGPAQTPRQPIATVETAQKAKAAPAEPMETITPVAAKAYDASRLPFAKDILSIRDCECKWWVSDGPLMFCAEEVVAGKSWCAHHLQRSKGKGTESERKAIKDGERIAA